MSSLIRTRWAAIGAAVAVTLGAGGIGLVSAGPLSSGARTVLVPANCRLADTRPAPDTVGPRTSPLGPAETYTLSAHGTNGNCTIPADATALALNVTALSATAPLTFLTLWNADQPQPTTSSLNPAAGQPPTPNAVNVDLSATGQFKIFNALGSVGVIIDVTGYYQDHNHDDRYDTRLQVYTGQLTVRYPANTGFVLAGDSFPRPLPAGTARPTLERITPPTFSANCPAIGRSATAGVLCVYEYITSNIGNVSYSGGSTGDNRLYGFSFDVGPSTSTSPGYYLASWAYRVPTS
jgi:hypothetical protein